MQKGAELDLLTGLGNGYDLSTAGPEPLVVGGGVGVPPMYWLTKQLCAAGCKVTNCVLQDTILDKRTNISGLVAHDTMLGADVDVTAAERKLFLGDNCKAEL